MNQFNFNAFILTFIPLFVAIDVAGVLPFYVSLTKGMSRPSRNRILFQALLTAAGVSIAFLFLGKLILNVLGITVSDFKIAGGIVLLVLAVLDLVQLEKRGRDIGPTIGVVPLGMPLIVGPAVLTTILKVASLLLAAIAVMMIRVGVQGIK